MSTRRYSISLGSKVLSRARKILGFLLLLVVILTIAGIHQGVVSKDFDKMLVQPFRQFATDLEKATEPTPPPSLSLEKINISTSISTSSVKINTTLKQNTPNNNNTTSNRKTYAAPTFAPQPTLPPQKSFEERVREMNERADKQYQEALKVQEEWSKQKSAENQAWFQQQSEAAKKSQEQWWAQKQKELEEWKKQNGF